MRLLRPIFLLMIVCFQAQGDEALDQALDAIAPGIEKWASICIVRPGADGATSFEWHDYRNTADQTGFWPASTIKVYAAIAALERLHERGLTLDTAVAFEHQDLKTGAWQLDCARGVREMLSEVFRRSSNEDYTLLLRLIGIDYLNTQFLIPSRGFPHSALMRGYVTERPWVYVRTEPQRVRLSSGDGQQRVEWQHTWSGVSYSAPRGCTVIDAQTGNVTSPRELADCLRRLLFHDQLPEVERFRLTPEMRDALLHGSPGFTGLEDLAKTPGPMSWTAAIAPVFPAARFYHKIGVISDYALELGAIDDRANGGPCFILVPVTHAGHLSKPVQGEEIVNAMSRAIATWVKAHR